MTFRHDFATGMPLAERTPAAQREAQPSTGVAAGRVRSALATGTMLGAIWAGLHWDDPASWVIGLPTVLAGAAATSLLPVSPPPRISLLGALRLMAFAIAGIFRGALDVSLLSLRPGRLRQGCLTLQTRLPEGRPRRLFALAITLLPGTLTVRLEGDGLIVHALDCGAAAQRDLEALEIRIAGLFDLNLDGDQP